VIAISDHSMIFGDLPWEIREEHDQCAPLCLTEVTGYTVNAAVRVNVINSLMVS
jgi:hypothetical protein